MGNVYLTSPSLGSDFCFLPLKNYCWAPSHQIFCILFAIRRSFWGTKTSYNKSYGKFLCTWNQLPDKMHIQYYAGKNLALHRGPRSPDRYQSRVMVKKTQLITWTTIIIRDGWIDVQVCFLLLRWNTLTKSNLGRKGFAWVVLLG